MQMTHARLVNSTKQPRLNQSIQTVDPIEANNNTTHTDAKRQLLLQARQAQHELKVADLSWDAEA